jgi:hypothetical protein
VQLRALRIWSVFVIWAVMYVVFYCFFIGETAARFAFPLYIVLPFIVAKMLQDIPRRFALFSAGILAVVLCTQLVSAAQFVKIAKGTHIQALTRYLEQKKFLFGYADYWAAYPVIFESNERVIISPTLLDADKSDRFPEYTRRVRAADRCCVIVSARAVNVVARCNEYLQRSGIVYTSQRVQEYIVYGEFSRKIDIDDLRKYIQ